jgi:sugar transferase (PEP-CTERM/EpsH1 system associated)
MPTRIMHVVDSLGKGGLENGLVNVVNGLDSAHFEHIVITIRALGPNGDRLPRDRVPVECIGTLRGSHIQVAALARAIRKFRPDIVHSRNWGAIEAIIAARLVGSCAAVHSEHGLESDAMSQEPWRRVCLRRLGYELASRVFSVSYQLRNLHSRRTGFPAHKIGVIHNGVDGRRFFPDAAVRARVRRELGLGEYEFCVGCVGNLLPVKDHMTLLKGAAALAGHCRNWRLLIIGEGPERSNLEAFVGAHPEWREQVSFLGTSNCVPELLNAMDVYVLPSIAEGISNSLLEAMAAGLPVVATATGGNPEVVVDRESGLLFPIGDCSKLTDHLLLLEGSRNMRLQLAQQAVRRVREAFSIDSMIQEYGRLYESLATVVTSPVRVASGA